jgi:uncharacterized protein
VSRRGDWMQTVTGRRFYPLDPRPSDVCIDDIAHALAHQCRFGGHSCRHYSVAEHSVLVSYVVPPEDALHGLLHDAAEAYVVDIPRPLKVALHDYKPIEGYVHHAVFKAFGLDPLLPESVHVADNNVLLAEREVLLNTLAGMWSIPGEPADVTIRKFWTLLQFPYFAKRLFLKRFHELWALQPPVEMVA